MAKSRKPQIKTVMWRLFRARKVITYDDLQELAGASRKYAQEWMAGLIKKGFAKKISNGRYMLNEEAYFQSVDSDSGKIQKGEQAGQQDDTETDQSQKPVLNPLSPGRAPNACRKERPEYQMWTAIIELKRFTFNDLAELNLACKTLVRQYLALLSRAGILSTKVLNDKKRGQYQGRYLKRYELTEKAGPEAPLVGRCFYIFDPNTGEYHTTDLMTHETDKASGGKARLSRKKKGVS